MRAVLQRVKSAAVHVDGACVSQIGPGLLVLLGISVDDTAAEIEPLCRKLLGTRLWDEGERAWRVALPQLGGELLLVSQFTLHARLSKGTKPDFHRSMNGGPARELYDETLARLRAMYVPERIKEGAFGAMMDVSLVNDGPVTLIIDTADKKAAQ
ncbi:D-tyrosyl-tRNA deacylase [Tilletiopsis washingtonensis]|uniref:D-aminoacyl-tRNA deacylase n=1 Tax=Tilletiopsis washingtonensis TaxID=58919 RepID=A0A316Z6Y2_9BASI|nr:D-tyrosyl-tRNA deacylase [Tilletiopsis washingtonensis]PWN96824.1 D-tyrosyl-tRNA deacylase [Tilletiopsis washingtonensis]